MGAQKGSDYAPSGYEIANRLSYLVWQSMPDQSLFDAAEKGELSTKQQIEAQARRMLKDPKASRLLEYFDQWLDTDRLSALDRDANVYPGIAGNLPELLQNETHAFVSYLMQSPNGNLSELLSAPYTFVNADLAKHYGVTGPQGPAYERVEMPGRSGVLTQGMLLSHDKPTRTSIVRRGLKVRLDLLCANVPAPPNDVQLNLEALGSGEIDLALTTLDAFLQHGSKNLSDGKYPGVILFGIDESSGGDAIFLEKGRSSFDEVKETDKVCFSTGTPSGASCLAHRLL